MKKKKILKIAFAIAISTSAIIAVAPTQSLAASAITAKAQSEAATSLNSKISKAKIAMKKPYDRYIKSSGKLATVDIVSSDITKAKKAQKDVNAAIKKAKLSSKQKKAKYSEVKAYVKYIKRAQGYVNAYQAASKASTTFTTLSGEISKAIVIKDVTAIQEKSSALKNAITAVNKEINHTVYGEKVKNLLLKKFTTPTENQVAALKALNKELFTAVLAKAKTQTVLKDILNTAPENAYVAIDLTGATEDLTFNTTKALNITIKGNLGGRNITINTPNSDIVNNATNVGTVTINDVSNNSFHQGSGTAQTAEYNDTNGGHVTNANFTTLYDLNSAAMLGHFSNLDGFTGGVTVLGSTDLTSEEFAKTTSLMLNLQLDYFNTRSNSSNSSNSSLYSPYVVAVNNTGLITGFTPSQYNPVSFISREQQAEFFERALSQQTLSQQQGTINKVFDTKSVIALGIELGLLGTKNDILPQQEKPDITLGKGTNVTLSGNFGTVTAEGDATVTVDTGSKVGTLVSNGDVTLTAPKGAISEISGSGTVAPTPTSEFNDTDVKNAGGTPASTTDSTQTPAATDPNPTPASNSTQSAAGTTAN